MPGSVCSWCWAVTGASATSTSALGSWEAQRGTADLEFKRAHHLGTVNSINLGRITAQIVYYFWAALALGAPQRPVSFAVPTGNFGDIFAGYLAHRMGLPVPQLIIATNANDILHRCISGNDYSRHPLLHTLSPLSLIHI